MHLCTPDTLLREHVRDLYSAEYQLILALPRVAGRVHASELRDALIDHLDETREHATRLERAAELLGFDCGGKRCAGMQGLLKEGEEALGYGGEPALVDAAIIAACRKVEHYEMAAYESARLLAAQAGAAEAAALFEQTLEEERRADEALRGLAGAEALPGAAGAGRGMAE